MELFLRIMSTVESYDDYFVQKQSAANIAGLSCFQKVTAAFRMQKWSAANVAGLSCFQKVPAAFCMLTHGVPTDAADEYVRIGESTVFESPRRFVAAVVDIF